MYVVGKGDIGEGKRNLVDQMVCLFIYFPCIGHIAI